MKLPAALVPAKMRFILRVQERALVMIEPPGETRIAGVFEIHDGILIPVELHVDEKLPGAVSEPLVDQFRILPDRRTVEVAEHGRGRKSVKAVIVVINLRSHVDRNYPTFGTSGAGTNGKGYHTALQGASTGLQWGLRHRSGFVEISCSCPPPIVDIYL